MLSKLDLDKETSNSEKVWEKKCTSTVTDVQSPPFPKVSDKRSSNSLLTSDSEGICSSVEKGKLSRTDSKFGTINGTWKKKYFVPVSHNQVACPVNTSSQASGENSLNSLRFQNYPNRKKMSRKDSLNVNISTRKDGQVIIGR